MPKTEVEVLSLCGKELSDAGHDDLAREAYLKMEDIPKVVALYVKSQVSTVWIHRYNAGEKSPNPIAPPSFLPTPRDVRPRPVTSSKYMGGVVQY